MWYPNNAKLLCQKTPPGYLLASRTYRAELAEHRQANGADESHVHQVVMAARDITALAEEPGVAASQKARVNEDP